MYRLVPARVSASVNGSIASNRMRDTPKSPSFMQPSLSRKRLEGLMSRWATCRSWQYMFRMLHK